MFSRLTQSIGQPLSLLIQAVGQTPDVKMCQIARINTLFSSHKLDIF